MVKRAIPPNSLSWGIWWRQFESMLPEDEDWSCESREYYAEGISPEEAADRIYGEEDS